MFNLQRKVFVSFVVAHLFIEGDLYLILNKIVELFFLSVPEMHESVLTSSVVKRIEP